MAVAREIDSDIHDYKTDREWSDRLLSRDRQPAHPRARIDLVAWALIAMPVPP